MLSGFNTNFRHRGVLFHVQSEDSGVNSPRVVTHLFRGGDILASQTVLYGDKLQSSNLEAEVRSLMENQHKSMLRALSKGDHDDAIVGRLGKDVFTDERGGDTDVTIPPPEFADAVRADQLSPEAAPTSKAPASGTGPESAKERIARAFGDGVVTQKPLDEVVLDFLVDNARKRKRSSK